jgi:hypothetical protein
VMASPSPPLQSAVVGPAWRPVPSSVNSGPGWLPIWNRPRPSSPAPGLGWLLPGKSVAEQFHQHQGLMDVAHAHPLGDGVPEALVGRGMGASWRCQASAGRRWDRGWHWCIGQQTSERVVWIVVVAESALQWRDCSLGGLGQWRHISLWLR